MDFKIFGLREDPNSEFYVPRGKHEIVQVNGFRHGLQLIDGIHMPHLYRNRSVVKNMDVREDDTFVISYPKSGIFPLEVILEIYCQIFKAIKVVIYWIIS